MYPTEGRFTPSLQGVDDSPRSGHLHNSYSRDEIRPSLDDTGHVSAFGAAILIASLLEKMFPAETVDCQYRRSLAMFLLYVIG